MSLLFFCDYISTNRIGVIYMINSSITLSFWSVVLVHVIGFIDLRDNNLIVNESVVCWAWRITHCDIYRTWDCARALGVVSSVVPTGCCGVDGTVYSVVVTML